MLSLGAADYSLERGLAVSDALVYTTARQSAATLYTNDEHLRGLQGVVIL